MPQRYGIFFNESKAQNLVHYKTVLKKSAEKPYFTKVGWGEMEKNRQSREHIIND